VLIRVSVEHRIKQNIPNFRLGKKTVNHIRKWTEKVWSHTSQNGLFVTVWPGDTNQNAFVGIALNKAKIVLP